MNLPIQRTDLARWHPRDLALDVTWPLAALATLLGVVWVLVGLPGVPLPADRMTHDERQAYCYAIGELMIEPECFIRGVRETVVYRRLTATLVTTR